MIGVSIPADMLKAHLEAANIPAWISTNADLVLEALGIALFFFLFGLLSRRLERQADVFAARAVEGLRVGRSAQRDQPVGEYGASVFASALHRVAIVNNIPIQARDYFHGSIASRMQFLQQLSENPRQCRAFDRAMLLIYGTMLVALAMCGAAAWMAFQNGS